MNRPIWLAAIVVVLAPAPGFAQALGMGGVGTADQEIAAGRMMVRAMMPAGAGVMGYSAIRQQNPPRASSPGQEARQPVAAAQVTQGPPRPAATKPVTDQGPLMIQVEVVDPEGRRLAGADVAVKVSYSRGAGNNESILERIKTNGAGQVQLEVARERPGATVNTASVWAYQPGRAIAATNVSLTAKAPPSVIHLILDQPAKWTITVLGPDDRPIAGLRLTPHSLRLTNRGQVGLTVPDGGWLEPLTVTTDAKGVAALTYLPQVMVPLSIRVAGPGVARHTLPLEVSQGKDAVLRLGRPGRMVGVVRTASGGLLVDVPVELWVQGSGTLPNGVVLRAGDRRITPDEVIRLDQQPLKTGPQGAFQTPPTLLGGLTYRVSIRHDGFVPYVSDWVTLNGERAAIPSIRIQPLQKLTGQIKDRQGRAVADARVFVPAGGPRTATDAEGRFALGGINPGKTVILVEQTGFRLQGWLVDPLVHAEVGSLTLVRASEVPGPAMKPLADPIPPEDSRALADHLLKPYLGDETEQADDRTRLAAISALGAFDPEHALELLQTGKFRNEGFSYQSIRASLAAERAVQDPARAEALAEAITNARAKIRALVNLAKVLPASERGRKQALLERAATVLRDRLQQANATMGLTLISAIAEQWLDTGERDRARLVLGGWKISPDVFQTGFLGQMARLEPDQAVARLQKLPHFLGNPGYRDGELAEVAVQLATDHPAEAERVFNLREGTDAQFVSDTAALRLCRRLARVDPPGARRVAASLSGPGARACAWAYVAFGVAEKDKAGASEAMDRAIQEIDRLRESGPGLEPGYIARGIRSMYPTNPAAVILPVVERIAPERLDEVFWRAVALHPRLETDREDLLRTSYIGYECMVLARYDREVAAALFEPADSYLRSLAARKGPRDEFTPSLILAKACLDPRAAVALLESLTPPGDFSRSIPAHEARLRLAEVLGQPPENRWKRLWHSIEAQVPLED